MSLFFGLGKIFGQNKQETNADYKGVIGSFTEDGFPVIIKFVNELPENKIMNHLPFLVVISWKYNGEKNNGMPEEKVNERMISWKGKKPEAASPSPCTN